MLAVAAIAHWVCARKDERVPMNLSGITSACTKEVALVSKANPVTNRGSIGIIVPQQYNRLIQAWYVS